MVLSPMRWKAGLLAVQSLLRSKPVRCRRCFRQWSLVAVVPDGVDLCGHTAQEGDVFVLDADAECLGRHSTHACTIRAVVVGFKEARAVSAGALTFLSSPP